MKTIVEVDNKQYVRDVIVYNSETQEPLVVTDSTPLLYLQRRGFKNIKTKEVPETWEELVELCKHYEDIEVWNGIIRIAREDKGNIEIYSLDGTIACNEYLLAEDRTISQMWEIIKNLMEEK